MIKLILLAVLFAASMFAADPIKVCQVDATTNEVNAARCFVVPSGIVDSFAQFITAQVTETTDEKGVTTKTPKYSDFWDLVVKHFVNSLVLPVLDKYPTAEMAMLKAQAKAVADAQDAAKAAILASTTGQ